MKKIFIPLYLFYCVKLFSFQVLEVPSEIGAGTRGASLGAQAIQIAALNENSDFFKINPVKVLPTENQCLLEENSLSFAKRIEKIGKVFDRVSAEVAGSVQHGFTLVLAGDHSTAAATIAGIKQAFPKKKTWRYLD